MILKLTSRGAIALPARLLEALASKLGDQLIAETTADGLLLRPAVTLPIEIDAKERIGEFDEAGAELASALPRKQKVRSRQPPPK